MKSCRHAISNTFLVFSIFCVSPDLQAREGAARQCAGTIVNQMRASYNVDLLAPFDEARVVAANEEATKPAISVTCTTWPADHAITVVAFAYDDGMEYERRLIVSAVDTRSKRSLATYKGAIPEDSASHVRPDSIRLDFAPYNLSPTLRAFAIRTLTFKDRCSYEGGSDDDLTLLAIQGSTMRPLLQLSMTRWGFERGNRCVADAPKRRATVKIGMAETSSHGLADLWISATRTGTKSTVRAKIRFDGQHYLVAPWNKAFNAWYEKTDRAWLNSLPR
jgi:hypothetical protein